MKTNKKIGKVVSMDTIKQYLEKDNTEVDETPLHLAAQEGNLNKVKCFVKEGADVNVRDSNGWTSLFYAVRQGCLKTIRYLIREGTDLNARANNGATALHIAACSGNLKIVQLLEEKGADINAKDNEGNTPLDYAIQSLWNSTKR